VATNRYTRQVRLSEVGVAGQARLGAARASALGEGAEARTAALYLAGAGIGTVTVSSADIADAVRAFNPEVEVRCTAGDPAPLGSSDMGPVARGALRALLLLRAGLEAAS
jgi:hypothetical protein